MHIYRLFMYVMVAIIWTTIAFAQSTAKASQFAFSSQLPPPNMFTRTVPVKAGENFATGFVIDYKGRQYLITAKHVLSDLQAKKAAVQLFENFQWKTLDIDVIQCKSPYVDAVALRFNVPEKLSLIEPVEATQEKLFIGAHVFFFGYPMFPSGFLHTTDRNTGQYLPFVKEGILSASDWSDVDARVYYFDAFNNKGFSGGPIVVFDDDMKRWYVIGVVSAYLPEPAQISRGAGKFLDSKDLVNSGVMVGHDIRHVLDAIDASLPSAK